MKRYLFGLLVLTVLPLQAQKSGGFQSGRWRGEFLGRNANIPFQFEVTDSLTAILVNGNERSELKHIRISGDSVYIPIELYDAVLAGKLEDGKLNGRFKKLGSEKPDSGIYFTAVYGKVLRFKMTETKPVFNLTGKWEIKFVTAQDTETTVGLFSELNSRLTGTIMTSSGDYRYLDGQAEGRAFNLSAFGGSNPYLLEGKFKDVNSFDGYFYTAKGKTAIIGKRNDKAELPDPYSLTNLKAGSKKLSFSCPNLSGQTISIRDDHYKNKVVVVTILGSWCPNCVDEAAFLGPWYKKNHQRGVEIVGLAFERKNDFEYAKIQLNRFKQKFDIQYDILFGGQLGASNVEKVLPELKAFFSFPTMIFIDRQGNVRKIHSGFNGPATGKYYDEFIDEFNREIDSLLSE